MGIRSQPGAEGGGGSVLERVGGSAVYSKAAEHPGEECGGDGSLLSSFKLAAPCQWRR